MEEAAVWFDSSLLCITISARSVSGEVLVRVGGEVVLVGSGQLDVLPS
jgi:hypothetical protein